MWRCGRRAFKALLLDARYSKMAAACQPRALCATAQVLKAIGLPRGGMTSTSREAVCNATGS